MSLRRPSKSSTRTRECSNIQHTDAEANAIRTPRRWKSDVNAFPQLDSQLAHGPTFEYEYSTREAYGANIPGWGPTDPLNATWWHLVTEGALRPPPSSSVPADATTPPNFPKLN